MRFCNKTVLCLCWIGIYLPRLLCYGCWIVLLLHCFRKTTFDATFNATLLLQKDISALMLDLHLFTNTLVLCECWSVLLFHSVVDTFLLCGCWIGLLFTLLSKHLFVQDARLSFYCISKIYIFFWMLDCFSIVSPERCCISAPPLALLQAAFSQHL